jgi:hypothetical protein
MMDASPNAVHRQGQHISGHSQWLGTAETIRSEDVRTSTSEARVRMPASKPPSSDERLPHSSKLGFTGGSYQGDIRPLPNI